MKHNIAHIDEAGARLANGRQLYVLAAVLTSSADRYRIVERLNSLRVGELPLHHYAERSVRRVMIAECLAEMPIHGSILLNTSSTASAQEKARARLMSVLLPTLEHVEHVRQVIMRKPGRWRPARPADS